MKSGRSQSRQCLTPAVEERIDRACDRFEAAWKGEGRPRIEEYVADSGEPEYSALLHELLRIDVPYRQQHGESPRPEDYESRFPKHTATIGRAFAEIERSNVDRQHPSDEPPPERIGRYEVLELIGAGGFGSVYLAHDEQLDRNVAIKLPHNRRSTDLDDVQDYLSEAQIIASLDHPNIVEAYDGGQTEDGRFFIVSRLIEGTDLAKIIKKQRPSYGESAAMLAKVADALQYAHRRKLIHRDIKPSNILIDLTGEPYVADFGLALREEDFGREGRQSGTPAYMSPEQARGEGHLVDGRSDIFSLGVAFYELLVGERPFAGKTHHETLEQIKYQEARPPRQLAGDIPKELERICLKALSKRAGDRYTAAMDMAEDLRDFLASPNEDVRLPTPSAEASPVGPGPLPPTEPPKIVPKGLRSFDTVDADFFLDLLPGPRDRHDLPESIRFWKSRIEETDADGTFRVGVIYGPSGCGKSSLVKAGLLPHLASHVESIYLECHGTDDEARLRRMLKKRFGGLDPSLSLVETFSAIRRGRGPQAGMKALIVLDQFEQWLHANRTEENAELTQALRQCDGEQLQCVLLVRDDFWMAVTRFMQQLEVPIVEDKNSAAVDLFDVLHAENVLAKFGRSFGRLANLHVLSKDQKSFLQQSVSGLARDEKVIPVQLALFAEMIKGKSWTLAELKTFGGTQGVTITFLEEAFSESTAPLKHRLHQKAARKVLRALLPQSGADMRGFMRSHAELLEASGYQGRPQDFADLMQILDSETRLLTPIEPSGTQHQEAPSAQVEQREEEKYYHLTHDHLVQPLRGWLTSKQKETARGRAQLLLAERANLWHAKPENRRLPTWWEWLDIMIFTSQRDRSETRQHPNMLRAATRYHASRAVVVLFVLGFMAWAAFEGIGSFQANAMVRALSTASMQEMEEMVRGLKPWRWWVDPRLHKKLDEIKDNPFEDNPRPHLNFSLALLPTDPSQEEHLYTCLLDTKSTKPPEFTVIRNFLRDYGDVAELTRCLWDTYRDAKKNDRATRLRAVMALAGLDHQAASEAADWERAAAFLADGLIKDAVENPGHYDAWLQGARPVRSKLVGPLSAIFHDQQRPPSELRLAATILADYAAEDQASLRELLLAANPQQYGVLLDELKPTDVILRTLDSYLHEPMPKHDSELRKDEVARRRAHAAALLLQFGHAEGIWPQLRTGPDPRVRTYLIHRLGGVGANPAALLGRIDQEEDVSVRSAIILSLGGMAEHLFSLQLHEAVVEKLTELYEQDADAAVHAAAEWGLRSLGEGDRLKNLREGLRSLAMREEPDVDRPVRNHGWYVDREGHTMVMIRGPVVSRIGSPAAENGDSDEDLVERTINRTFAIASTEVTLQQFLRSPLDFQHANNDPDCPVNAVSWYDAAKYCRWLSEQHDIPEEQMCYPPITAIKHQMKPYPDYLTRTGYRLPTEAEWEYSCRAGTTTSRYHGSTTEMLPHYAWYRDNATGRTWPVAMLKPNDLGFFDMLGNVAEWCCERYLVRADERSEDKEDTAAIETSVRAVRGGKYGDAEGTIRSANRQGARPDHLSFDLGFRVARTLQ